MHGLFDLFYDGLPVAPSQTLPTGKRTRGWTLRPDRLNATATRFDWIHGTTTSHQPRSSTTERDALRTDVLTAASRLAADAGFRVRVDGTGLLLTPAKNRSRH